MRMSRARLAALLTALLLAVPGLSWAMEHRIFVPFALREVGYTSSVAYYDAFRSEIIVTNVGDLDTTVHASFHDFGGNVVHSLSRPLGAKATTRLVLAALFRETAFAGSAVLVADQPLAAIVAQRPSYNYDRPAPLSRAFASRGEHRAYLPTVLRYAFDSTTRFGVQNTTGRWATVSLTIYDAQDQKAKYHDAWPVAPWASRHVDVGHLSISGFSGSGSAVIESTGTIVASAMELATSNQHAKGYEGVARGSRRAFVATALCQAFGGTTTYFAVQNTSMSSAALVRAEYSNGAYQDVPIAPGAKASVNPCAAGAGAGFSGAVQMRVIGGQANILVLAKATDPYNTGTAFHGVARGGRRISLPYVRWSDAPAGGRTYVAIQNLGDETQWVSVRFHDSLGTQRGGEAILRIDPLQKGNVDFSSVGSGYFYGSALIEGLDERANLNVMARTVGDDDTNVTPREDYNGFVVQGALLDGIDISHGTGEITVDDVRCWVDSGVEHVIVRSAIPEESGGTHRETTKQQLRTLWHAMEVEGLNFSVDLYVYVFWKGNSGFRTEEPEQVRQAIAILEEGDVPPVPVGRMWVDIENNPAPSDPRYAVSIIGQALEACGDFPCGIYTRATYWDPVTDHSAAFSDYPLWYAQYVNQCPLDPTFRYYEPFGGWTEPLGKQYADNKPAHCSGNLCGKSVDYDIMYVP